MKPSIFIVRSAFILAAILSAPVHADSTIVIVRHGEKPPQGLGQLTCKGLNRALALAPVLLKRYGSPVAIYAPDPSVLKEDGGIRYPYIRPLATVEPLAVRVGLPVDIEWGAANIEPLVAKLLATPTGTQVVAWEHHWAESLAKRLLAQLGGNPAEVPQWADSDYDSIYLIRIGEGAKGMRHASFSREQEGLNGLPDSCFDGSKVTMDGKQMAK